MRITGRGGIGLPALAALAALGTAGCAAKVNKDVFETEMAQIRSELDGLDGRVQRNSDGLAAVQARLDSLADGLAALEEEFDAQVARLEYGVRFAAPVHFAFDRADVRPEDVALLERFADVVGSHYEGAVITVEGFADPAGPADYNRRLSKRRADAVVAWLTSEGGLPAGAFRTEGYGETRLVAPGAWGPGEEGRRNRRVAFVVEYAPFDAPSAPPPAGPATAEGAPDDASAAGAAPTTL